MKMWYVLTNLRAIANHVYCLVYSVYNIIVNNIIIILLILFTNLLRYLLVNSLLPQSRLILLQYFVPTLCDLFIHFLSSSEQNTLEAALRYCVSEFNKHCWFQYIFRIDSSRSCIFCTTTIIIILKYIVVFTTTIVGFAIVKSLSIVTVLNTSYLLYHLL